MGVLVDTSVWITHFARGSSELRKLLTDGEVFIHPFVIGELACGNLKNPAETLTPLRRLPVASVASDDEVLAFLDERRLAGRGLGLIDVHLLASAILTHVTLWTTDRRLRDAADVLGVAYR